MQRIEITIRLHSFRVWPWFRRLVGMMPCDRQIGQKKMRASRKRVEPCQRPPHRRWFIHAKARLIITSDYSSILEYLKAALFDHCPHPQIHKTAGMKERGSVACSLENGSQRWGSDPCIAFRFGIDRRVTRGEDRKKRLDAFGIDCIGFLEDHRRACQFREVRHRVATRPIWLQIFGSRRFEHDHYHIAAGSCATPSSKVFFL